MKAHQADYPITTMCDLLGVSTSGYYAWLDRGPSARDRRDAELSDMIRDIHTASYGTYGSPRILRVLKRRGEGVGKKRVARLMRQMGLEGVSPRSVPTTTTSGDSAPPAPDLVDRDFEADAPDLLWVADITYVPTAVGFMYLAVVLDVYSRRIVGWSMASHLRTALVVDALDMALKQRRPDTVVHHSDQGTQYTSIAFGNRCQAEGVQPSMGSVGDCYDNAMCESFFSTLECELIDRMDFSTRAEAKQEVFRYIEGWYNPHRIHSALDYLSPVNYEKRSQMNHAA